MKDAASSGTNIAIKHAKFPDGRIVYGPVWGEKLAKAIDAAIRRAVKSEQTRIIGIVEDEFAGQRKYAAIRIVGKINQAKRPSRKRK